MSNGLMMHIREDLSSDELQGLVARVQDQRGLSIRARASRKPHLHFVSTDTPPHLVLQAVKALGYHACLVDL